jgi:hypothetical protein
MPAILCTLTRPCLPAVALLLLAGCADRAMRNTPEYRAGYSDGCASATLEGASHRDTSLTRDEATYRSNPAYHNGWGAGFGVCRAMAVPASPAGDPLAMPRTP